MIELVIDNDLLQKYSKYYFKQHPKARKVPIEHPYHPSINKWFIMPRQQMNALKQKWKDFMIWYVAELGYEQMNLENFTILVKTYMPTKRRIDTDNTVPKFILDGLVEGGLIVDDDSEHLHSLTLQCGYDKDCPRTEIIITEE